MSNSTPDSYQLYLALRRSEQEGFCSRYGYNYQSTTSSTGSGTCYHTQNNVADFVTSSSSRNTSAGSSHSSKNCTYRSLFG